MHHFSLVMCMVRLDLLVVQKRTHSIIALEKEEDPKCVQKNTIPSFVCVVCVYTAGQRSKQTNLCNKIIMMHVIKH